VKNFIALCATASPSAPQAPEGLERSKSMFALLIAFGSLFLAVAVAAVIDPRVDRDNGFDDLSPTTDEIALPV
jgi:hypothetical protein